MAILIAEDAPVDAIILRNIVTHACHVPIVVGDGEEALAELERRPEVLLVFADVRMPTMGGVELLRAMRERPALADIPLIFVSGAADVKTVREALTLRPAGYLLKPLNEPSRVLELIAQSLEPVVRFLTGEEGDPRHRNERVEMASALRALLEGGDEPAPALEAVAALGRNGGAPRLAALGGAGAPSASDPLVQRTLRGTLNALEARGY